MRSGRGNDELRKIEVIKNLNKWAEGSAEVIWGGNRINVTASLEKRVPPHLLNTNSGWIAVEYRMLPRSTSVRKIRNENLINTDARQVEISRILGRIIRNTVDLTAFPKKTIWLDCDVIQADGGTRIAALFGAFIALHECLKMMRTQGIFTEMPLKYRVCGISAAIKDGEILVDPDFNEDFSSDADINIFQNDKGEILEIQGGAEGRGYSGNKLMELLEKVQPVFRELFDLQKNIVDGG